MGFKERKAAKLKAAEEAKAEAEYEAKYQAKMKKKEVEKSIAEIDKSLQVLMQKAADAKAKGYDDVYQQCLGMVKVTHGRKAQAEKFLFQMDAMQELQNVSKCSAALLGSINDIMGSLGKLSLDRSVISQTQRDVANAQRELDMQSNTIDGFLEGLMSSLPEDANFADVESNIGNMALGNQINSAPAGGSSASSELDDLKKLLQI